MKALLLILLVLVTVSCTKPILNDITIGGEEIEEVKQ